MGIEPTVHLSLETEHSSGTISGQIRVENGSATGFFGWLELIDQLERVAGRPGERPSARDIDPGERDRPGKKRYVQPPRARRIIGGPRAPRTKRFWLVRR
jgi:hypothetical protein